MVACQRVSNSNASASSLAQREEPRNLKKVSMGLVHWHLILAVTLNLSETDLE